MITPQELAERIKSDITSHIRRGIVPESVQTFADLHDYVDANCYGGSEALLDELASHSTTDEQHAHALDALCGLMNPAMDIVNEWLAAGGHISQLVGATE